ncbi:MAG: U32 family peptidase [Planctomycetes bacterium]|nr:U32 family peptidase [Planctomycetota bacterium]
MSDARLSGQGAANAEAPPEPAAPQGEYNPHAPEEPLLVPQLETPSAARPAELLAPAGGPDAGYAAFHYGADAVYLGLKKFSARAEAENFSLQDVDAITAFAHAQPVRRRVFVTVNTLILQNELEELVEALGALSDIGVDALIVQDLGVYRIVREHFPEIELHASTQLAVHNRAGAETLRRMGFKRVVLARELTFEEIREITAASGIETEVFIHGALCYSYSGLCLFSSQTIGRSGNRGKCAYTCRDGYTITGAPNTLRDGTPTKRDPSHGYPFSMKDLALPDHVPSLRAAGVSCFKIEGRKKSPLYAATTTNYYRRLLDGRIEPGARSEYEADMQTVFSRPWTRLFIQSHKDKEVADRDSTSHRGTPIGVVETVLDEGTASPRLRFRTSRHLELHDGLQIDIPGLPKPFGFAVERLWTLRRGKGERAQAESVFDAPVDSHVEVELPEDHPAIPLDAHIYCSSSQSVKQRYRYGVPKPGLFRARRAVELDAEIAPDSVTVRARIAPRHERETAIEVREELRGAFETAKNAAKTEEAFRKSFEKLGETRLAMAACRVRNPRGLFVPVSQLNELRRQVAVALEKKLESALAERDAHTKRAVLGKVPAAANLKPGFRWSIKVDRIGLLDQFEARDWDGIDEIVVEIARDNLNVLLAKLDVLGAAASRERIRLALPAVTRKWEEADIRRKLERLRGAGYAKWEAGNLAAWSLLGLDPLSERDSNADLATDWPLYVVNRAAAQQALAMGARRFALSPEDGLGNMRPLLSEFGERATVIVHQDTPLFIAESCAYANLIGGCPGKASCRFEQMDLVSSYQEKVTAIDYHCRTLVLNHGAYCLAPRLKDLAEAGAVSLRADFILRPYTPAEVREAWRQVRAGKNVTGGHAANFDRGML